MSDDDRTPMANITPFGLRMQPELKAKIEASARTNNRSMNAEIVTRLDDYDQVVQWNEKNATQIIDARRDLRILKASHETLRIERDAFRNELDTIREEYSALLKSHVGLKEHTAMMEVVVKELGDISEILRSDRQKR